MRLIIRSSSAVSASIRSPKYNSSRARLWPIRSGITRPGPACENKISGSPNRALSAAIVKSQNIASSQPPPSAWPCTEAITGLLRFHGVISASRLTESRS